MHRRAPHRDETLLVRVGRKEESEYSSRGFNCDAHGLSVSQQMRTEIGVALAPSTQPKECVAMRVNVES